MASTARSSGLTNSVSSDLSTSSSAGSSSQYADIIIETGSNRRLLTTRGRNNNNNPRHIRVLAIASLVLSLLCLGLVAALFLCWVFLLGGDVQLLLTAGGERRGGGWGGLQGEENSEVCLPCLQLSPNPLEAGVPISDLWEQLNVRRDENDPDSEICCASNTKQYAQLFKLIIQRQEEVKKIADALETHRDLIRDPTSHREGASKDSVSAHLLFNPVKVTRAETETKRRLTLPWKSPDESPMSHVTDGLRLHNRKIYVNTPGLYFVYCQVLYAPSSAALTTSSSSGDDVRREKDKDKIASAYISRSSILRQSSILLKSRHTRHAQHDRHSSYVGAVFRLHTGDTLAVEVSQPDHISHDDVATFFGLFKVGP